MEKRYLFIILLFSFVILLSVSLFAQPFSNGEGIDYKIYASGFYVGYQTIGVVGDDVISGKDVWVKSW